jgi:putative DNA primase/helicase
LKDNEELRGLLNSGHTKAAAHVIRNVKHKPRRFSTWAPKAIATIGALADTLEDRAVVVPLQRKPPGATVERLRRRDNADFAGLRSQAARWAADSFDKAGRSRSENARSKRPRGRQLAPPLGDR